MRQKAEQSRILFGYIRSNSVSFGIHKRFVGSQSLSEMSRLLETATNTGSGT